MESLEALNRQIFLFINADDSTSAWLLTLAKFLAKDTLLLLPLLLAGLWLWGGDARRQLAVKAVVVTAVSLAMGCILGLLWFHPRPFMVPVIGHTYIQHVSDASFPSDHTTIFFAIGFCLLAAETRLFGLGVLAVGAAMAWARIFTGLHFPLDIIGAVVLAYAVYRGLSPVWNKYAAVVMTCLVRPYRIVFSPLISLHWVKE